MDYKEIPRGCTHYKQYDECTTLYYKLKFGTQWDFYAHGEWQGGTNRHAHELTPIPNDILMDSFLYHERKDKWKLIRSVMGSVCLGLFIGSVLLAATALLFTSVMGVVG